MLNSGTLNQADANKAVTSIKETLENLKNSINAKGKAQVISNVKDIKIKKKKLMRITIKYLK